MTVSLALGAVIAVDGPAAAGKGTLARQLARHFGFAYLDTGSLYRAVAHKVLAAGGEPADPDQAVDAARRLTPEDAETAELRTEKVAAAASRVAAMPEVRKAILAYQREFAANPPGGEPGAVLDGRDIGTVVCPQAAVKLFVTASLEKRSRRRLAELQARRIDANFETVRAQMAERDARDRQRPIAPLKAAQDAHLLDTTNLDIDSAFSAALALIAGDQKTA